METFELIPPYITDRLKLIVGLGASHVEEAKSAQQRVLIFHYDSTDDEERAHVSPLRGVLESGGNCLVVRIWRGGSRWWNLTQAKDVQALAAAELQGYQWAHKALGRKVPKLLYASKENESPWALFEYVGHRSKRFNDKSFVYDQYWTETMIKVRDEFGFHELHPRWGRVPVKESWLYTKRVLHQVTIPLHQYFYQNEHVVGSDEVRLLCGDLGSETSGYTYMKMVRSYRKAFVAMKESLECTSNKDTRLSQAIDALEKCIKELEKEHVPPLPCVLLHMDCQPQNLVFAKTLNEEDPWCVSSILDWEDCAYGDPRFEILLLGRKVSFVEILEVLECNVVYSDGFFRSVRTDDRPSCFGTTTGIFFPT